MRTLTCEKILSHPDGVIEIRFTDTNGKDGAITFPNSTAFSEWMQAAEDSLNAEHLLAMALMPSFRAGKIVGVDTAYDKSKTVADMKGQNPGISITVSL